MYLYAIIDVYSRYIVGWRLSNSLSAKNCHEQLQECIGRHGAPEILNSDQGSQYTTRAWEELLAAGRHQDKHGRSREMQGQHLDRAFLAQHQAGVHIHHARGQCHGFAQRCRQLHGVLQRGEDPPETRRHDTCERVPCKKKKTRPDFDSMKMMHTFAPSKNITQ